MSTPLDSTWRLQIEKAVLKHFRTSLDPLKVLSASELPDTLGETDWANVRLYGWQFREQNDSNWKVSVVVDVLSIVQQTTNAYKGKIQANLIASYFVHSIKVLDTDDNLMMLLKLDPDSDISIQDLARRSKDVNVYDQSISSLYRGYLTNG